MAVMVLRLHSGDIRWMRSGDMRAETGDHIATVLCGSDTSLQSALCEVARGFGLWSTPRPGDSELSSTEILERLRRFVEGVRTSGTRAFVVLDHPDALSSSVLDELRALTNAAGTARQPAMRERAALPVARRPLVPTTFRTLSRARVRTLAGFAVVAGLVISIPLVMTRRPGERVLMESPGFLINVASFDTSESATGALAALTRQSYPAFVERVPQDGRLHVLIGPYASPDEAGTVLALVAHEFPRASVTSSAR